jgi:hypothetical protein
MNLTEFRRQTAHLSGDVRIDIVVEDLDGHRPELDTTNFEICRVADADADDDAKYIELVIQR